MEWLNKKAEDVNTSGVSLTGEEVKVLVDYLDKMDKEHASIPSNVQDIAEKLWDIAYPGK